MRKKFLALSLAVIVSAAQVMTVSASKQEKLQQQQAAQAETSAQLDNAKAEIDDLETKKNQITGEIDDLDAQLVVTMASVENLKNEIAEKQTEIEDTQKKLSDAQAEEDEQYEQMKKRIKFLYESGGDNGWAALILEGKDLSSMPAGVRGSGTAGNGLQQSARRRESRPGSQRGRAGSTAAVPRGNARAEESRFR